MREVVVKIKTDHDDTLRAVQSVAANLGRAGYVVGDSATVSVEDKPFQEYMFVTRHADLDAMEIDLHMEETRRANEE